MRAWRFRVGVLLATLAVSELTTAQSLAEIARKERERRAKLDESSEARVVGNEELEAWRGEGFSVAGAEAGNGRTEQLEREEDSGDEDDRGRLTAKEVRELRDRWAKVWKRQMESAEGAVARAKENVFQCRAASRYFFVPLAVDCAEVEQRLAEAEATLKEVRANRFNWELLLPE